MVRIWVKERLYWGRKKVLLGTRHITKNVMRAGRVVFFLYRVNIFCFFFFKLFDFWTGRTTRNTHILLRSVFSSVLQSCFVFFALKKSFCIPCWEKFEKLPKTFSYENDERSHAITKTTHLFLYKFFDIKVQREIINWNFLLFLSILNKIK